MPCCVNLSPMSLMIWSTAEGFGGPYGERSTDVGTSVIYVLVFVGLLILYRIQSQTPFTLDSHLRRRFPDWPRMGNGVPLLSGHWRPQLAERAVSDRSRGSSPTRLGPMKSKGEREADNAFFNSDLSLGVSPRPAAMSGGFLPRRAAGRAASAPVLPLSSPARSAFPPDGGDSAPKHTARRFGR